MSLMTDEELRATQRAGEVAEQERAKQARQSVIFQSTVKLCGLRAIELEARRRMALE